MSVVGVTAKERPVGLSAWARTLLNAPDVTMLPSQQRRDARRRCCSSRIGCAARQA
jgi:hypothetical protein